MGDRPHDDSGEPFPDRAKRGRSVLAAVLGAAVAALGLSAAAETPRAWRQDAIRDLTFFHTTLKQNHPAMIVAKDSTWFRTWVDRGFRDGLQRAKAVTDARGYYRVLRRYAAGFHDGHINVAPSPAFAASVRVISWPGIATTYRSGAYFVSFTAAGETGPAVGARLVSCDGDSTRRLAETRLAPYDDLELEAGRFFSAPHLLWVRGFPTDRELKSCQFEADGRITTYSLRYRPADGPEFAAAEQGSGEAKASFGLERVGEVYWIGLPSLNDDRDWSEFFSNVDRQLTEIRAARDIVIDVRGDRGGNSGFADQLADKLWGPDYVKAHAPQLGRVLYRTTALNASYWVEMLSAARRDPVRQDEIQDDAGVVSDFERAKASGRPSFIRGERPGAPSKGASTLPPATRAKVWLLTDFACGSACLDLMDEFLAMPNVTQIGTSTWADTIYMDTPHLPLPSGHLTFAYGHKAWIDRPRGSNIPYRPAPNRTYRGDISDDPAWRRWTLEQIQGGRAPGASPARPSIGSGGE